MSGITEGVQSTSHATDEPPSSKQRAGCRPQVLGLRWSRKGQPGPDAQDQASKDWFPASSLALSLKVDSLATLNSALLRPAQALNTVT